MFYNSELFSITAKNLALFANDQVSGLASAIASDVGPEYPAEFTGAAVAVVPHFVEKAILTTPSLPGDVSARLSTMFVDEFETVAKMVCNMGGFSNPIKKALFNASFRTMFRRQYKELKPTLDTIWHRARKDQSDPLFMLAVCAIAYCEESSGQPLQSERVLARTSEAVRSLFAGVHERINGA